MSRREKQTSKLTSKTSVYVHLFVCMCVHVSVECVCVICVSMSALERSQGSISKKMNKKLEFKVCIELLTL